MWHLIPSIHSLRAFDAVARHQSMTRAAAEANVTQSAISQSIGQLEGFLGTRLLDRSSRPVALTDEGVRFQRLIEETYSRLAHHVEGLRASHRADSRALTVSCSLGFATYWLMPRLGAFNRDHPDATLNVMTSFQGNASSQAEVDVAIRFGKLKGAEHLLFEEQAMPVCAPAYLDRHGPIEAAQSLCRHRLIHVIDEAPSWMGWEKYLTRSGAGRDSQRRGARFSNYVQAVQSCLAGDGIMLGWRSTVGELLASGQVVRAIETPLWIGEGYSCQVAAGQQQREIVSAFMGWLTRTARETPAFATG